ncbi:acylneuraminate cytidylyltransferase [Candidatus Uhrbacteria bacterium]|nr:acylneuraminate cytidylyltransferase [Candidatus Uhrbacteria bacterium]
MKLAAVLACRNQSARLYGKPLQNLDVERRVSILDYLVAQLKMRKEISEIVLAISQREENKMYIEKSREYGIPHITGDDEDVLGRLIKGAALIGADHVFRVTTESPYPYLDTLSQVCADHDREGFDYSVIKSLPDGAYYQVIKTEALKTCWEKGGQRYRNEYCTKYIFDHKEQFKIKEQEVPAELRRASDIRLTVDWPEDLIVMREIYKGLNLHPAVKLNFLDVITFLDKNPKLNAVNNWIDSGKGRIWT